MVKALFFTVICTMLVSGVYASILQYGERDIIAVRSNNAIHSFDSVNAKVEGSTRGLGKHRMAMTNWNIKRRILKTIAATKKFGSESVAETTYTDEGTSVPTEGQERLVDQRNVNPRTPVGRKGSTPLTITARNKSEMIHGRKFTGHALDQMQSRGLISPTAVLDVIDHPTRTVAGNEQDTLVFIKNDVKVVTNKNGDVLTVMWQREN